MTATDSWNARVQMVGNDDKASKNIQNWCAHPKHPNWAQVQDN